MVVSPRAEAIDMWDDADAGAPLFHKQISIPKFYFLINLMNPVNL